MSLFEDAGYRWRETFFVLFKTDTWPSTEMIERELSSLGARFEISNSRSGEDSQFESLTLKLPHDFAAMDISGVRGEDVQTHVYEIIEEMENADLSPEERERLRGILHCDARFDIYHFEQVIGEEDEFMDPGGLFMVVERLAKICDGIGIDPQSGTVI